MRIKTTDGTWMEGKTAADLVRQMHDAAVFAKARTDKDFMEQAAQRAMTQCGAKIQTHSADLFLADLAAAGLIVLERS